ncbi:MAG TPA: DUF4399 domain-containing protein [Steroidobacteraceae bacterium]|jgi:hypothetical protein|nr:DUF4399 domain-containing protein [Steroidobacteraceae bacterium]
MDARRIARAFLLPAALALGVAAADGLPRTPSPKDVELYIISPRDGETVASPVTVRFGLRGMGIAPAGVAAENTGHHHLLIDTPLPPVDRPIPADEHHVHFGKGQTEASVTLGPGKHTLQLLLGDHLHIPHDPPVASKPVTITVE